MINNWFSEFLFPYPPPDFPKWDTTYFFGTSPRTASQDISGESTYSTRRCDFMRTTT